MFLSNKNVPFNNSNSNNNRKNTYKQISGFKSKIKLELQMLKPFPLRLISVFYFGVATDDSKAFKECSKIL